MFSDNRTPAAPGEQKGFKSHHGPHFIPWLRNSLKPHHGSSDLGLNGPYKSSSSEGRNNNLTPLERAKGIGFFSIQGRDRIKKGELQCNGLGMARMLPVVLRGHHILPGSLGKQQQQQQQQQQQEDSSARWKQPPELLPDLNTTQTHPGDGSQGLSNCSTAAQDNSTSARNHSGHLSLLQSQNGGTPGRKYGPLVGLSHAPVPAPLPEEPNCKVPVVVATEDRRGKVWDYASATSYCRRDFLSSSWLSAETQVLAERQQGLTSSFSSIKQQSRNSQSQRDLTALREPPVEGFNGPLNGLIFSTKLPPKGLGCTATLRGPRKPRPNSEHMAIIGQNQTWVQCRPTNKGETQRREAGCSRKVVRNQIKRVVNHLEQVLTALRDVQQEMKEVVQEIDFLTSSIDLNEEETQWRTEEDECTKPPGYNSNSSSGSNSSETHHQRPSEHEEQPGTKYSCSGTLRKDNTHRRRSRSPPNVLLCPVTSSENGQTLRYTSCGLGSSPRRGGPSQYNGKLSSSNPPPHLTSQDLTLSPPRNLPVRPPTPALSPLTVNLQLPGSPGSQPQSPVPSSSSVRVTLPSPLCPKPHPPPTLTPSVTLEYTVGSHQTPRSAHPSAAPLPPSSRQAPSASCPPTDAQTQPDREMRASSSAGPVHGPSQVCNAPSAAAAKPPTAQGRRGRKPPPYRHHHRPSEHTKEAKEPRKAPPYPEKRRLLSTTV